MSFTMNINNYETAKLDPIQRSEIKNKCAFIKPYFKDHQISPGCRVIQEKKSTQIQHLIIKSSAAANRWNILQDKTSTINFAGIAFSAATGILSGVGVSAAMAALWWGISGILDNPPKVQVGFKVTTHTTFLYRWSPIQGRSEAFWGGGVTITNEVGQLVYVRDLKTIKDPDLSQNEAQAILQAGQGHQESVEAWN
jgi:hypothetical protein